MSLVTSREMLARAMAEGYGVPAFNANCLEMIPALIAAAQAERAPLIVQISKRFLDFYPARTIAALARRCAEEADVPVCIHLDHGASLEQAEACLKAGFTSIMYDGSALPHEQNIAATRAVARLAADYGVPVEGEIGRVLMDEDVQGMAELTDLTEPADAADFVARTGVSSVAVAIGNVHRMRRKTAALDFARIAAIRAAVRAPLVIHGSSGVSDEDVARAVSMGITKVNVATEFSIALVAGVQAYCQEHPQAFYPMDVLQAGLDRVIDIARSRIRVVRANGRV
ncbi:MAG: class II fructose-bisphosphate aldolase [Christensenellales bacterium]|jgi:ketose-bisphosphate aldolase